MRPLRPLRRRSVKVYKRLSTGPVLPPWVKVLPFALGAFVVLLLASLLFDSADPSLEDRAALDAQVGRMIGALDDPVIAGPSELIDDGSATPATTPAADPSTQPTVPGATTAPAPTGSSPQTGTPVTVTLQRRGGGAVRVDEGALQAARAATVALFTGDFAAVPLGDGVSVPALNRTWKNPYVGEPVVVSSADGTVAFAFRVDPDRDGAQVLREVTVFVGATGNGWVWLGV